jgi:hypothetical protein
MEIRIAVPRVPSGLLANLLGLVGLVGVALAVGGLSGSWWWSILVGGVFAVGLSYVAQTQAAAAPAENAPAVPLRAVETLRIDERTRDAAYMRGEAPTVSA